MNAHDYSITFAVYNQVDYTRQCIDSMIAHGTPLDRVVVVDNASTDETRAYLETLPLGGRILNRDNLGCGTAWNQGALHQQAEWTVVMNNDVLVSANWIENLIGTAIRHGLKVASPALLEGALDYDFQGLAPQWSETMREVRRDGICHAVCLVVHRSVWMEVGYFRAAPALLGYEDTLFFAELARANIASAIVGASWLHHYGSITQSAMKRERGLSGKQGLGMRRNYRLLNQSWLSRKLDKMQRVRRLRDWRDGELARYGMTVHGVRKQSEFEWL
ncbi:MULTISPECIES: glycosyltransferase family 2 protein [Burkholderia]|uniref:glycosyltransferase family 2 protein n=1 Tax=Burkholderia TaxID=32008 RepID=UPI000F0B29C2|nr:MULTISPECIES: glycosyltransferase [Burkholderia]AYQ87170.1 glycosyltransferase [Burkholderia gladioli]NBI49946.1 glycosyltransferase [Burkholderia sp. ISTR5]